MAGAGRGGRHHLDWGEWSYTFTVRYQADVPAQMSARPLTQSPTAATPHSTPRPGGRMPPLLPSTPSLSHPANKPAAPSTQGEEGIVSTHPTTQSAYTALQHTTSPPQSSSTSSLASESSTNVSVATTDTDNTTEEPHSSSTMGEGHRTPTTTTEGVGGQDLAGNNRTEDHNYRASSPVRGGQGDGLLYRSGGLQPRAQSSSPSPTQLYSMDPSKQQPALAGQAAAAGSTQSLDPSLSTTATPLQDISKPGNAQTGSSRGARRGNSRHNMPTAASLAVPQNGGAERHRDGQVLSSISPRTTSMHTRVTPGSATSYTASSSLPATQPSSTRGDQGPISRPSTQAPVSRRPGAMGAGDQASSASGQGVRAQDLPANQGARGVPTPGTPSPDTIKNRRQPGDGQGRPHRSPPHGPPKDNADIHLATKPTSDWVTEGLRLGQGEGPSQVTASTVGPPNSVTSLDPSLREAGVQDKSGGGNGNQPHQDSLRAQHVTAPSVQHTHHATRTADDATAEPDLGGTSVDHGGSDQLLGDDTLLLPDHQHTGNAEDVVSSTQANMPITTQQAGMGENEATTGERRAADFPQGCQEKGDGVGLSNCESAELTSIRTAVKSNADGQLSDSQPYITQDYTDMVTLQEGSAIPHSDSGNGAVTRDYSDTGNVGHLPAADSATPNRADTGRGGKSSPSTPTTVALTSSTHKSRPFPGGDGDHQPPSTRLPVPGVSDPGGTPSTTVLPPVLTERTTTEGRPVGPRRKGPKSRRPRPRPTKLVAPHVDWSSSVGPTSSTPAMVAIPSNNTLSISNPVLGTAEITGIAMACLVVFWLILGPLICFLMRTKDKNKTKRRERLRTDSMSHVLVEEMIRMELARGRAKMYRTNVHDEREIQRLPSSCGNYHDSPTKHSVSVDGITGLRNACSHEHGCHDSPVRSASSYEKTPFALHCMSGSGSINKERHLLNVQNNLCYEGTPNKEQLQQLSQHRCTSASDPSSVNKQEPSKMAPSKSQPIHSPPPPPLPPRIPLRRKLEDAMPLSEKSTQTPPWDHRHRRKTAKIQDSYRSSPQPPVPKPRKSKSPNPKPRKPPRKNQATSPKIPKNVLPKEEPDPSYVDCLVPQRNNNQAPRSPQRIYNFDKMNGSAHNKPVDIIRDIVPNALIRSPLIPARTTTPNMDNSSEDFYQSDPDSLDSLDKHCTKPWTYLPENNCNVQRMKRYPNHAYVPIHDTKL